MISLPIIFSISSTLKSILIMSGPGHKCEMRSKLRVVNKAMRICSPITAVLKKLVLGFLNIFASSWKSELFSKKA